MRLFDKAILIRLILDRCYRRRSSEVRGHRLLLVVAPSTRWVPTLRLPFHAFVQENSYPKHFQTISLDLDNACTFVVPFSKCLLFSSALLDLSSTCHIPATSTLPYLNVLEVLHPIFLLNDVLLLIQT